MPISLASVHRADINSHALPGPTGMEECLSIAEPLAWPSPLVRLVGLRDRNYYTRLERFKAWTDTADVHHYREDDLRFLAQASLAFDVLVIHGEDTPRLKHVLQVSRAVLTDKLIIVICPLVSVGEIAAILDLGADDVIPGSAPAAEISARIRVHLRRREQVQVSRRRTSAPTTGPVFQAMRAIRLTPGEQRIMAVFARRAGQITPLSELLRAKRLPFSARNLKSLQVSLCLLRRKLPPGYRIENVRGSGYRLLLPGELPEPGTPTVPAQNPAALAAA